MFWVCLVCLFTSSTRRRPYIVQGISGDIRFTLGTNLAVHGLIFVIGIAQGIGKASVYRIIHDYYPQNMGSVGAQA